MQFDLLIPKNNEEELAQRAKDLGIKVIFLKEFSKAEEIKKYKFTNIGLLVKVRSKKDLIRAIQLKSLVKLIVAVSNGEEEINRIILSSKGIDYAFGLATATGKDHTHYRRGGVNQVLAKLAKENRIAYGLGMNEYTSLDIKKRIILLGRWIFNSKIFRKYSVPVELFSLASKPEEMKSKSELITFKRLI